ncbi:MAG: chemotaxis-specific protein-glutamate methyltransferase CheB [Polyangiaceae bacterium]
MNAPLRIVIADDSALYRAVLQRCLMSIGGVEIVAQAANGVEAVDLVQRLSPDVLTLDLNMPILDGIGTLRAMKAAKLDCETIVVSAETRQGVAVTLEALHLGAVDFITKPAEDNAKGSTEILSNELRRQFAAIRLRHERKRRLEEERSLSAKLVPVAASMNSTSTATTVQLPEVVAIGASTGGPQALPVLLGGLPPDLSVPVLIVQHMPPLFTASLAESLDRKCTIRVVEGHNGQLVSRGHVYIAPGGKHLKVKRAFDKSVRLVVTDEPPENHCRPSVDVLFRSVASEYGGKVIAAILTGMGNDGVAGLRILKGLGANVIAQNEATCTVFGMPQEAIRALVVDSVLPLERIAPAIVESLRPHAR